MGPGRCWTSLAKGPALDCLALSQLWRSSRNSGGNGRSPTHCRGGVRASLPAPPLPPHRSAVSIDYSEAEEPEAALVEAMVEALVEAMVEAMVEAWWSATESSSQSAGTSRSTWKPSPR